MIPQGAVDAAAGFGDYWSFGITGVVRTVLGDDKNVNTASGAYKGGEIAGQVLDVATVKLSSALRRAAKSIPAGALDAIRKRARYKVAKLKVGDGKVAHHVNTLVGHPAQPGRPKTLALFPTAGLPEWIRNAKWNVRVVSSKAEHHALHLHQQEVEKFAFETLGIANSERSHARHVVSGINSAGGGTAE